MAHGLLPPRPPTHNYVPLFIAPVLEGDAAACKNEIALGQVCGKCYRFRQPCKAPWAIWGRGGRQGNPTGKKM